MMPRVVPGFVTGLTPQLVLLLTCDVSVQRSPNGSLPSGVQDWNLCRRVRWIIKLSCWHLAIPERHLTTRAIGRIAIRRSTALPNILV